MEAESISDQGVHSANHAPRRGPLHPLAASAEPNRFCRPCRRSIDKQARMMEPLLLRGVLDGKVGLVLLRHTDRMKIPAPIEEDTMAS